ncbi:C-terminal binding protein [Bacillus sp. B15-48]|uniref:C-terminal binding protein n=1 Tax=Bacillus sp. B15-48 TaxID=1548601 RepID=UPI00193FF3A6|nr:C-terminal binding protein [Bacillus sp. B15-48]MBM4761086.1 C-terminal binding protein [Bacillus sp. B15-48]
MKKPFKITIVDYEWPELDIEKSLIQERMRQDEPIELQVLQTKDKETIIENVKDADAILTMYGVIDKDVLMAAKKAKIISRYGIGVNMIDVEAATELGKMVGNVNDYCIDEVSDHALAFIMSSARRLFDYNELTKKGEWDFKQAKIPLRASYAIVGLVGFGKIPVRLAEKLTAIGYQVMAYDPFVDKESMAKKGVIKAELHELVANSDFISVHVPLIEQTRHLISSKEFELMKNTAYIINTARGPIIDEAAMITALNEKKIAGCGLDVTETEPLPQDHILRNMDNVILSPHAAWYSETAFIEIRVGAISNILDVYDGKEPKYLVNLNVLSQKV